MQVGRFDEGMRRAEPDEVGLDGRPAKWQLITSSYGSTQNYAWGNFMVFYDSSDMRLAQASRPDELETTLYIATKIYEEYGVNKTVPPLFVSAQEAQQIGEMETVLRDYAEQSLAEFVTGARRFDDTGWNSYTENLERLGLSRYLEIYQNTFEKSAFGGK